jgi:cysteine synthase A
MIPDTGERYLSTPLFAGIPVEMDAEETALLEAAMPAIAQSTVIASPERMKSTSGTARDFVARTIDSHPNEVVMFGLSWCEFCWSVRKLLDEMKVPFVSVDLDTPDFRAGHDVPEIRAALEEVAGAPTLPQLFVDGIKLGGCMEVLTAAQQGDLQRLLMDKSVRCDCEVEVDPYQYLPNWVSIPESRAS